VFSAAQNCRSAAKPSFISSCPWVELVISRELGVRSLVRLEVSHP
ncbi:uncharacterized protein METZ01_LOCUS255021, partial [marine metagenome]